jgi:hypothetical protein
MGVVEHFLTQLSVALHHLGGDKLVVENTVDAAFYHTLIVCEGGRVDHIIDNHIGENVREYGEHNFPNKAGFVEERK